MSASENKISGHNRIHALDAIRQMAAFLVLVQHFFVIFQIQNFPLPRGGIFDAKGAVTLFFVLSGYVLALSLKSDSPTLTGYVKFGVRRVLRLYPLHFAATLLALLVLIAIRNSGGYSSQLPMPVNFLESTTFELKQWLLQLTLVVPGMDSDFANPPVWTLMAEANIAIIFPLLGWFILRSPLWRGVLLTLCLALCAEFFQRHVVGTLSLVGMFALGALLTRIPESINNRVSNVSWLGITCLSLALYATVSFRHDAPSEWIPYYVCALGAAGIIGASIHWKILNRILSRMQSFFRVDISYGIYILHYPIMLTLWKLAGENTTTTSAIGYFLLSIFLTISLSVILMFLIERPAIKLGKHLTGRRPAPAP